MDAVNAYGETPFETATTGCIHTVSITITTLT